ncbi:hypothetical protein [Brevundimonas bacteroides]|uniref:hypothetical protein n=1 Tax=Brevundimonas bacteroides TaxID=74311 RepID=UPI000A8EFF68|nr:hypothetical protein [Brevundimonas bacteroides]
MSRVLGTEPDSRVRAMMPTRSTDLMSNLIAALLSQAGLIAVTVAYALVIHLAHSEYLGIRWAYYGFTFDPFSAGDFAFVVILSMVGAIFLPKTANSPSAVILWQLFVIVYVPTITITTALRPDAFSHYGLALAGLSFGFAAACRISGSGQRAEIAGNHLPSELTDRTLLLVWFISTIVLIFYYRNIISFVSLDNVYVQRMLTRGQVGQGIAYIQTYYSVVLAPLLFVVGIIKRKYLMIAGGLVGFVLTYGIDAQKITIAIAVAILIFSQLHKLKTYWRSAAALTAYLLGFISVLLIIYISSDAEWSFTGFQAALDIAVFRMIALPGLTFSQYADLFGERGLTYWSNTRGISLLVPPPDAFANHPDWPHLGRIVGDFYYNSRIVNANANPFSGEGVAAAGPLGVILIGCLIGAWLRALDWAARGWDPRFANLVVIPVGLSLTNGHLATVLLTFGGAFWIAFFTFARLRLADTPRKKRY